MKSKFYGRKLRYWSRSLSGLQSRSRSRPSLRSSDWSNSGMILGLRAFSGSRSGFTAQTWSGSGSSFFSASKTESELKSKKDIQTRVWNILMSRSEL